MTHNTTHISVCIKYYMYHKGSKEQEERMEEVKHNVVCYGVAFAGVQHTSEVFKVGGKFHTFLTVSVAATTPFLSFVRFVELAGGGSFTNYGEKC